jgi:hypothetical protein
MGTRYTTQGITGYNADPPPDNATKGDDNKVAWVNHVEKIGDPIKTQAAAIDTAILDMVDVATIEKSANYTTVEDDNGRVLECISSPDITLGLAATMGSGYKVTVKTVSGTTTVSLGGADEIDGSATDRSVAVGEAETYVVNDAADAYLIAGAKPNTFATGTRMLFQQTAAPTGWTKDTTSVNNRALRVVSGDVVNGGDTNFTTVFSATRVTSANGAHLHAAGTLEAGTLIGSTVTRGSGGFTTPPHPHGHDITGNTDVESSHTHTSDLNVFYLDVIVAVKD